MKTTINWRSLIQYTQVFYIKVSRFHRLTSTHADVRRSALERRSGGMGQQQRPPVKEAHPCHINKSFVNAGWRCEEQVAMMHDEVLQDHSNWVQSCLPNFQLGN